MKVVKCESLDNVPSTKDITATLPYQIAVAKKESDDTSERIGKDFKDKNASTDKFVKDYQDNENAPKKAEEAKIQLDESLFEDAEPKKRGRKPGSAVGMKYDAWVDDDEDEDDLWTRVYTELLPMAQMPRKLRRVPHNNRQGYDNIFPSADGGIIINATSADEFDLAKEIADAYGVTYTEPVLDPSRKGKHFPYTMTINIPEGATV